MFVESGGDNLAATFSPELSDLTIYVIDVAAGEKIPRKGGPGITKSDLFVINKTDLAPYVGASLDVMRTDTLRMRGARPFVMTNLKTKTGLDEVVSFTVPPNLRSQGVMQRVGMRYDGVFAHPRAEAGEWWGPHALYRCSGQDLHAASPR